MKRLILIIIVAVAITLAACAPDSGTSSPNIGDIQTLVDQQILKGNE